MISFNMITQPTIETKLADWITAFNSISNKQSEEAQILKGLVNDLKTGKEELKSFQEQHR